MLPKIEIEIKSLFLLEKHTIDPESYFDIILSCTAML